MLLTVCYAQFFIQSSQEKKIEKINENISFSDYKDVFNKYLAVFGIDPIGDNVFENESFEEEVVELQSQPNYFWLKIFTILGFGALAYWLHKR